jgi:uncharacterized protein (TIGR02118 family)
MIRVSGYYPNTPGAKFDHEYYANKHAPMVLELLGASVVRAEIDKGLAGASPDVPAPYVAVGHLIFNSLEDFQQSFGAHGDEVMSDVPNYTDIEPIIQISEITVV